MSCEQMPLHLCTYLVSQFYNIHGQTLAHRMKPILGSAKANLRKPKSCLGQVFNFN
jgi:hypothetical protein